MCVHAHTANIYGLLVRAFNFLRSTEMIRFIGFQAVNVLRNSSEIFSLYL